MPNPRLQRLQSVLDTRQPDLRIFLEKVHKPHNLSAILRTCDAVGVHTVHAVAMDEQVARRNRSSSGTDRWVNVVTHPAVESGIDALRSEGIRIYAAHLSEKAVDYRDIDYTLPTAVLMGAELEGVTPAAANSVDDHITIPMYGLGSSLNVSVAAGVILYEAQRQRRRAGYYEARRLSQSEYEASLFEWLYPRVAEACQRRGMGYPPLDGEGHIIGNSEALVRL